MLDFLLVQLGCDLVETQADHLVDGGHAPLEGKRLTVVRALRSKDHLLQVVGLATDTASAATSRPANTDPTHGLARAH